MRIAAAEIEHTTTCEMSFVPNNFENEVYSIHLWSIWILQVDFEDDQDNTTYCKFIDYDWSRASEWTHNEVIDFSNYTNFNGGFWLDSDAPQMVKIGGTVCVYSGCWIRDYNITNSVQRGEAWRCWVNDTWKHDHKSLLINQRKLSTDQLATEYSLNTLMWRESLATQFPSGNKEYE